MRPNAKHLLTADAYLAIERKSEFKSEYFAGEMFAMAGASKRHNLIVANITRILGNQLLESDCNVYAADMRVLIHAIDKYTYPDVVVSCQEDFEDDYQDSLLNPVVIIEVLSESTEGYDRGKKFFHYQYLESFFEYLLVSQEQCRIEQYVRQKGRIWTYFDFRDIHDVVKLNTIRCEMLVSDVYAKVSLSSSG